MLKGHFLKLSYLFLLALCITFSSSWDLFPQARRALDQTGVRFALVSFHCLFRFFPYFLRNNMGSKSRRIWSGQWTMRHRTGMSQNKRPSSSCNWRNYRTEQPENSQGLTTWGLTGSGEQKQIKQVCGTSSKESAKWSPPSTLYTLLTVVKSNQRWPRPRIPCNNCHVGWLTIQSVLRSDHSSSGRKVFSTLVVEIDAITLVHSRGRNWSLTYYGSQKQYVLGENQSNTPAF